MTDTFIGPKGSRMSEFSPEYSAYLEGHLASDLLEIPGRIKALLRQSHQLVQGFEVTQLEHGLQTATLAERSGADIDIVVAALCHDMGKVISTPNHGAIAAEMIKMFVSEDAYFVVKVHQDFEGVHYLANMGIDPMIRRRYEDHPAYELAEQFADDWDERAFDPDATMYPLEHFEPMIDEVFSRKPKLPEHWVPTSG